MNDALPHAHRLDFLDTARGIAAVVVIASHYVMEYGVPRWPWAMSRTPLCIWRDGAASVSLFFVLSGLVLSLRHFRTSTRPDMTGFGLSAYFASRVCRIWLPYVVVLAISAAAWHACAAWPTTYPVRGVTASWLTDRPTVSSLAHALVLFRISYPGDHRFALVPQAWSLADEMILSCLVPAGVLLAARGSAWLVFSIGVAVYCAGLSPLAVEFAIGILIAKHYRALAGYLESRPRVRLLLFVAGVLLYTSRGTLGDPLHLPEPWATYPVGFGAAILLVTLIGSPGVRGAFSRPFPRHVGRVSYSVYLIHFAVLFCLTPRAMDAWGRWGLPWSWGFGFAFTVAVSLLIAGPMYRWIEVPTIAIGRMASAAAANASSRVRRALPNESSVPAVPEMAR